MLVIISDLHLHDGSVVQQNVSAKQVHDFWHNINRSKKRLLSFSKSRETKIELVVLGDFLDLIRTDEWDMDKAHGIKPWSAPGEAQKDKLKKIIARIFENNKEVIETLRRYIAPKQIQATYMIGNHDHLLLRYPDLFRKVHRDLGFSFPEGDDDTKQFHERTWLPYGVMAHHGDRGDPWNDTRGLLHPIGDAMVTEIYNQFPKRVVKLVSGGEFLKQQLENLVFVRPYRVAPFYIIQTTRQFGEEEKVKRCWNDLVEEFIEVDFVKMWTRESRRIAKFLNFATALSTTIKISKKLEFSGWLSLSRLANLARAVIFKYPRNLQMIRNELKSLDDPRIHFLVNGHTHNPGMLALGKSKGKRLTYINTGTWTRTLLPDRLGPLEPADRPLMGFTPGDFISYVTFFTRQENPSHDLEFWSGRINPRED